ncbi:MAG: polysaccharide deacetylase family protein [Terricaulis sp.]
MRVSIQAGLAALCALVALAGCASAPAPVAADAPRREIALTYDDSPRDPGPFMDGPERARRIVAGLREAGVAEAMFFANPGHITGPEGEARLRTFTDAGHVLANHSNTHPNLRDVTAEQYLADVAEADRVLRPMKGFVPIFRFPYLSEGDTVEKRDAVRAGLIALGYAQGYVTTDSYDWRIDQLAREAVAAGKEIDMDALRDFYVRTAVESAGYYDRMAVAVLGRSPRHVMLLHETDLAAYFTPDLVAGLRADGWTIIPATEAFADPIATEMPNTLALSGGRVAAMMHERHAESRFTEQHGDWNSLTEPFEAQVVKH